ncbi:MAG: hypothetical protein RL263_881 [Bacteroidota bacterium]
MVTKEGNDNIIFGKWMFKAFNIHNAPIKIKIRPLTRYDLFFIEFEV